ncbi:hypothetical protein JCM10207_001400 [Rhodosporidiobolus poonsookiae]
MAPSVYTPTPVMLRVQQLLRDDPTEGQSKDGGWEAAWQGGATPWDGNDAQPALRELIEERWGELGVPFDSLKDGKVLIAGCGKGYDATYFASRGLDAVGMDLSETAIQRARDFYAAQPDAPKNVTFLAADFFAFSLPSSPADRFSLAYDYTFFCAIPPSWREKWGARYAEVVRPGGLLVALAFPLDGDREGGPPYSVSEEAYDAVLSANFEKIYSRAPGKSSEGREGRDKMLVYRRKE